MRKSKLTFAAVSILVMSVVLCQTNAPNVRAGGRHRATFNVKSLRGVYSSVGRADGAKSVSVGIATFDGDGGVTRFVRINASDGEGGRRLIDISSQGSYEVYEDGTGVIDFTNTIGDTMGNVTFDFVIRSTTNRRGKGNRLANDIVAVQREAGITASLIEASFVRQRN